MYYVLYFELYNVQVKKMHNVEVRNTCYFNFKIGEKKVKTYTTIILCSQNTL